MNGANLRLRIGKAAYERLADPEFRFAIFEAMGLDVREMDFWDEIDRGGAGTIKGWFVSVRPRGESA